MRKPVLLISSFLLILGLASCGSSYQVSSSSSVASSEASTEQSSLSSQESSASSSGASATSEASSTSEISSQTSSESSIDGRIVAFASALAKEYTSFEVTVKTTQGDISLVSDYKIQKGNDGYGVDYSIQKMNTFDLEKGLIPNEMISTEKGHRDEKANPFSLEKFSIAGIDSYTFGEDTLTVRLANGKTYLQADYDCLDCVAVFTYADSLSKIDITYHLSDQTQVETHYIFNIQ